jgi:hypothetical protein
VRSIKSAALRPVPHRSSKRSAFHALLFFVSLLLLLSTTPTPAGEKGDLQLQGIRFALGNKFRNRAWAPVIATLVNEGEESEDVTLSLTVSQQGEAGNQVTFSRSARLPGYSSREVMLDVLIDSDTDALLDCFRDKRTGDIKTKEETLSFEDGTTVIHRFHRATKPFIVKTELYHTASGNLVDQNEIYCHPSFPNTRNVYSLTAYPVALPTVATRMDKGLEYIYGETAESLLPSEDEILFGKKNIPSSRNLGGLGVSRSITHHSNLPRKWAAYHGVDVIVLGSPRNSHGHFGLDPLQQSALLQWVWSGGQVTLLPSVDPEAFQHPFFEKLLPVRPLDNRPFVEERLLTQHFGGQISRPSQRPGQRIEALPGTGASLVDDSTYTGLAVRSIGHGRVWFSHLSSDQMQNWSQNLKLWQAILTPRPNPAPGLDHSLSRKIPALMQEVLGISAPDRRFVIVLLGGYCLLAMALLIQLRRKGRTEWGWPLVILLAVGATALAKRESDASRERTGFVQGELGVSVLGNRSGVASAYSFVSVYSPKQFKTDATFLNPSTLAAGFTPPKDDDSRQGFLSSLKVHEGDRFQLPGLHVGGGELFTCRALTLTDYQDGIDLALHFQGEPQGPSEGISGRVTNRTGETLTDCFLALNRGVLQIGVLKDGESRDLSTCRLSRAGHLSAQDVAGSNEDLMRARTVALVRRQAGPATRTTGRNDPTAYEWPITFYGWARRPQALVSLGTSTEPLHAGAKAHHPREANAPLPSRRNLRHHPSGQHVQATLRRPNTPADPTPQAHAQTVQAPARSPQPHNTCPTTSNAPSRRQRVRPHGMEVHEWPGQPQARFHPSPAPRRLRAQQGVASMRNHQPRIRGQASNPGLPGRRQGPSLQALLEAPRLRWKRTSAHPQPEAPPGIQGGAPSDPAQR